MKNNNAINTSPLILSAEILTGIPEIQDIEFHKKIYLAVKKGTFEKLSKKSKTNPKKELKLMEKTFTELGWGEIKNIDMQQESKKAIIILKNSPLAASLKGKTKLPADVLLRGALAGIFSKIFNEDIDCVESECSALQGKQCKFIIKPKTEFDFSNKIVQDQLSHE